MGRRAGIWRRKGRTGFYAKIGGRITRLGDTREEAQRRFHELKAAGVRADRGEDTPVADVFNLYLDRVEEFHPDSYLRCRRALATFDAAHPGLTVRGLRAAHVAAWFARHPAWCGSTRHVMLGWVVAALNWAVKPSQRLIPFNPLAGIERPPIRSRGRDAVPPEEVRRRLEEAADPALRQVLFALRQTGRRPVDLCRLTAASVDLDAGVATLGKHKTGSRSGRPLQVPLTPPMVALLRGLVAKYPEGPLFRTKTGVPWTSKYLTRCVGDAREKAGLPKGSIFAYCYRHTLATELLEAGVPEAHVAQIGGWASPATLHRHYAHLDRNLGRLGAAVDAVINGPAAGGPSAAPGK